MTAHPPGPNRSVAPSRGEADTALYLHRPLALCAHATPLMMQVVAAILLVASTVEESVYGKNVDGGNTNEIIALSRESSIDDVGWPLLSDGGCFV